MSSRTILRFNHFGAVILEAIRMTTHKPIVWLSHMWFDAWCYEVYKYWNVCQHLRSNKSYSLIVFCYHNNDDYVHYIKWPFASLIFLEIRFSAAQFYFRFDIRSFRMLGVFVTFLLTSGKLWHIKSISLMVHSLDFNCSTKFHEPVR